MTLRSFTKNLLNQFDCRAIINVDPAGDTANNTQMDVVNLCREYFDEVIYRTPETPSFGGAVQWCWQQVQTDFFFHLEDDWILKRKVNPQELLQLFDDTKLVNVVFNKWGWTRNRKRLERDINEGNAFPHSENFLTVRGFGLNPGFIRTNYIKQIVNRMELGKDPAYQFVHEPSKYVTQDYPNPLFLWMVADDNLVINVGGVWRRYKCIAKDGNQDAIWSPKQKPLWRRIQYPLKWRTTKWYWQTRYCQ